VLGTVSMGARDGWSGEQAYIDGTCIRVYNCIRSIYVGICVDDCNEMEM
jgi:hypothetical protein